MTSKELGVLHSVDGGRDWCLKDYAIQHGGSRASCAQVHELNVRQVVGGKTSPGKMLTLHGRIYACVLKNLYSIYEWFRNITLAALLKDHGSHHATLPGRQKPYDIGKRQQRILVPHLFVSNSLSRL